MTKFCKMIVIIKFFSVKTPRDRLLKICKSFIKPHLDHGDIIYKPNNESLKNKIKNIK